MMAEIQLVGLVVSLDRQERGNDGTGALQGPGREYRMKTASIVTMENVVKVLKEENRLDADLAVRVKDYYEKYGTVRLSD